MPEYKAIEISQLICDNIKNVYPCYQRRVPMAYDKSVFILGAGASVPAGAPVLNDFLKRSRELLDNPNSLLSPEDKEAFKRVFEWRGRIYPALRYLKLDLENMENLFCLVDMAEQLGIENVEGIRDDMIRMVARTLDLTVKFGDHLDTKKQKIFGDRTLLMFIDLLIEWRSKTDVAKAGLDSIITLNYDIACEQAFAAKENRFTYSEPWTNKDDDHGYKLLKLHGSVNWGICPNQDCKYTKSNLNFGDLTPIQGTNYRHIQVAERIYHPQYYNTKCTKCGKDLSIFIVPPTWNKLMYSNKLKSVWISAREELEQATRIIIIGYSLPETDSFFKYLLALSLSKNESLQEIILINPAKGQEGEALEKRYRDFIAPFFDTRNFSIWPFGFQEGLELLRYKHDPYIFKDQFSRFEEESR